MGGSPTDGLPPTGYKTRRRDNPIYPPTEQDPGIPDPGDWNPERRTRGLGMLDDEGQGAMMRSLAQRSLGSNLGGIGSQLSPDDVNAMLQRQRGGGIGGYGSGTRVNSREEMLKGIAPTPLANGRRGDITSAVSYMQPPPNGFMSREDALRRSGMRRPPQDDPFSDASSILDDNYIKNLEARQRAKRDQLARDLGLGGKAGEVRNVGGKLQRYNADVMNNTADGGSMGGWLDVADTDPEYAALQQKVAGGELKDWNQQLRDKWSETQRAADLAKRWGVGGGVEANIGKVAPPMYDRLYTLLQNQNKPAPLGGTRNGGGWVNGEYTLGYGGYTGPNTPRLGEALPPQEARGLYGGDEWGGGPQQPPRQTMQGGIAPPVARPGWLNSPKSGAPVALDDVGGRPYGPQAPNPWDRPPGEPKPPGAGGDGWGPVPDQGGQWNPRYVTPIGGSNWNPYLMGRQPERINPDWVQPPQQPDQWVGGSPGWTDPQRLQPQPWGGGQATMQPWGGGPGRRRPGPARPPKRMNDLFGPMGGYVPPTQPQQPAFYQ